MNVFTNGDTSAEISETFFEPQVIPPFHSSKVAEPSMGKLMQVDVVVTERRHVSHLILWKQQSVSERSSPYVFHISDKEFRTVDDIVFGKGEFTVEKVLVEFDSLGISPEN